MMSNFLKEIIKNKIKLLHPDELLQHAKNNGFSLSVEEANHIVNYIQNNDFDIFSRNDLEILYNKLAEITDFATANKAKALFERLIKSYGLEDYFE